MRKMTSVTSQNLIRSVPAYTGKDGGEDEKYEPRMKYANQKRKKEPKLRFRDKVHAAFGYGREEEEWEESWRKSRPGYCSCSSLSS